MSIAQARMIRSCAFQNSVLAAGFVPFDAGYAARSPWILSGPTNFVKRSKAPAHRTAEATSIWTPPPAEKVHKINKMTFWLPGRRKQENAEGGKSFRESSIRTMPSQSPERGTGVRRSCSMAGLGGECSIGAQKEAPRSVRTSLRCLWRGGLWPSLPW